MIIDLIADHKEMNENIPIIKAGKVYIKQTKNSLKPQTIISTQDSKTGNSSAPAKDDFTTLNIIS